MGFIVNLLTAPVLGPIRGVMWLGQKLAEVAETELFDEDRVNGQLLELQMRLEVGEITEDEYSEKEKSLMEELRAIREAKSERNQQ